MKSNIVQNILLGIAILYAASFLERYLSEYKDHKTITEYKQEKKEVEHKIQNYERQISIDSAIIYNASPEYLDSIRATAFERYRQSNSVH